MVAKASAEDKWAAVRLEGERLAESEGVDLDYWIEFAEGTTGATDWIVSCYPKQHAAIFSGARRVCVEGSTKSGKTEGALKWQYLRCIGDPIGGLHLWVAPVQRQADIAFTRVRRRLAGQVDVHLTTREIRFENGAVWRFVGSDKPDHIYGDETLDVVCDEASRCRAESVQAADTTLSTTDGPMLLIGNVSGRSNEHWRMCRIAESGRDGWSYAKITAWDSVDAGVVSRESIEERRATMRPEAFAQDYECVPADDGGNPFGISIIQRQTQYGLSPRPPVAMGLDVARKRDFMWLVGLDSEGLVCVSERWNRTTWHETYARCEALITAPCLIDATGLGDVVCEELNMRGLPVDPFIFTAPTKQRLIEDLQHELAQGRAWVLDGEMRAEMETFEVTETAGGVTYSAPSGMHDDGVCALALAWRVGRTLGLGRDWREPTARTNSVIPWLQQLN